MLAVIRRLCYRGGVEQPGARYHYLGFGLSIHSDVEVPELFSGADALPPNVHIRRVASLPAPERLLTRLARIAEAAPGEFRLTIPEAGAISVRGGTAIDVVEGEDRATLHAHLIGSAFGALLHQRGLVPLHASAIDLGGRAVAFAGESGAGKSTLALRFRALGHPVLSDDICALAPAAGAMLVQPGIARLKLWRSALDAAGLDAGGLDPAPGLPDKFQLPGAAAPRAVPLGALVLLDWSAELAIERLRGAAALAGMAANVFRDLLVQPLGLAARQFEQIAAIAATVPVVRLGRPRDFARIDEVVDAVRDLVLGE